MIPLIAILLFACLAVSIAVKNETIKTFVIIALSILAMIFSFMYMKKNYFEPSLGYVGVFLASFPLISNVIKAIYLLIAGTDSVQKRRAGTASLTGLKKWPEANVGKFMTTLALLGV